MAEVPDAGSVDAESHAQMIICRACVELATGVGWCSAQGHVTTIFREKNCVAGVMVDGTCPWNLPKSKIGVSVEANQDPSRLFGISNDESNELLSIDGVIADTAAKRSLFRKEWRFAEKKLLFLSEGEEGPPAVGGGSS